MLRSGVVVLVPVLSWPRGTTKSAVASNNLACTHRQTPTAWTALCQACCRGNQSRVCALCLPSAGVCCCNGDTNLMDSVFSCPLNAENCDS